jgi:hypothetical protein
MATTTAPIEPQHTVNLSPEFLRSIERQRIVDLFPEFLRIPDVESLYGIRRSKLYELLTTGEVKSVSLRKKGARTGVRLVSTQSLRDFLNSQMEEQNSG